MPRRPSRGRIISLRKKRPMHAMLFDTDLLNGPFLVGSLVTSLDAFAQAHNDLAPVVVIRDQLGEAHSGLFGSLRDTSGEPAPRNSSPSGPIARGFGVSAEMYDAASPLSSMVDHAPYADTVAISAVGQHDRRFEPVQTLVSDSARKAER